MISYRRTLSTCFRFLVDRLKAIQEEIHTGIITQNCLLCGLSTQQTAGICQACQTDLPWLKSVCRRCAHPLPEFASDLECAGCKHHPPAFDRSIASFCYRFPIDHAVHALKYDSKRYIAEALAQLMHQRIRDSYQQDDWPECLIPVPLDKARLKARGYNQARLLSHNFSREMHIPCMEKVVKKVTQTPSQVKLKRAERLRNLRRAFRLKNNLPFQHVAIVDDVMTTCATAESLSRLLKSAGVRRVDVWVVARTPSN